MIIRTFDIPEYTLLHHPREIIFASKFRNRWKTYSTLDYYQNARHTAIGFLSMGVEKGDTIGTIVSTNLAEWNFIDMGVAQTGAIHVPIYPSLSYKDLHYILTESKVKYLVLSDQQVYENIRNVLADTPGIEGVYSIRRVPGLPMFREIIQRGKRFEKKLESTLELNKKSIRWEDPATLIYSSGTTGVPKGVLLSHRNLVSNILISRQLHPLKPGNRILSFLPLSHIYERTSNYQWQLSGLSIYYAENISKVLDNMKEVRPHGFTAVPRVLEKIRNNILDTGHTLKGWQHTLFKYATNLAVSYPLDHNIKAVFGFKLWLARMVAFRSVKKALGGRIRFIGCGGARLSIAVERFFWTAGLPVFQGYGLTETSPLISLNRLPKSMCRIGTVGPVVPGVEVAIAADGEILCKGPNVMLGYYNDPELTRKSVDADGWFYTGDTGEMIENRFLVINGRKKDLFKTSYGKYIAPQVIESLFRESKYIAQIMVIGEGEKFAAALIIPDFERLSTWARIHTKIRSKNPDVLIKNKKVRDMLHQEIRHLNESLGLNERIKGYELLSDEWTVRGGALSPSLKLRREYLLSRYSDIIKRIFHHAPSQTISPEN